MRRIVIALSLFALGQAAVAADQDTVNLYNRSCIACHSSGVAGAPRAFNDSDWAPKLEKGMATLLKNTINGVNAMPAKGLCPTCSEQDFEALIQYMSAPK